MGGYSKSVLRAGWRIRSMVGGDSSAVSLANDSRRGRVRRERGCIS